MVRKLLLLLILFAIPVLADPGHVNTSSKKGNFANPVTPITVFGFGQDIIDRNQWYLFMTATQRKGDNNDTILFFPSFIYGITDFCSLYVAIPTFPKVKLGKEQKGGLSNVLAQLECALYQGKSEGVNTQISILGSIGFPTTTFGNKHFNLKSLIEARDSFEYFLGGTASYLSTDIYAYASLGNLFKAHTNMNVTTTVVDMLSTCSTEQHIRVKNGGILFYQFGIGHNLGNPWGTTLLGSIEMNGYYEKRDTIKGVPVENSGGNTILLGPTLCMCTSHWLIQAGILLPALQKLNGDQPKTRYVAQFDAAFIF